MAVSDAGMEPLNDEEALEMFLLMKEEYQEAMNLDFDDLKGLTDFSGLDEEEIASISSRLDSTADGGFDDEVLEEEVDIDVDRSEFAGDNLQEIQRMSMANQALGDSTSAQGELSGAGTVLTPTLDIPSNVSERSGEFDAGAVSIKAGPKEENGLSYSRNDVGINGGLDRADSIVDDELAALKNLLPAYSYRRLRKIQRAFHNSLGDPSMTDLIPLVRERMPDYLTATWLKQMSALTTRYVVQKASEDGLVDEHMVNGALEVETSSGSLDRALDFYNTEFSRHGLTPNQYSSRLVVQMMLKNNRFSRAMAFKDRFEGESGQNLDILAYGSLVEYCSRRKQVGSALMLLAECLEIHGAAPGEASLSKLRDLCRKAGIYGKLTAMVGEDPVEWLKHGERHLKREMSKKGRRDVQFARNRLLQV